MEHSELHIQQETGHASTPMLQDASFWVALAIVIFVALAFKTARRLFIAKTDDYAAQVAKQLREAKSLRAEAEALLQQYSKQLAEGKKQADEIVASAKRDAETMAQQGLQELRELLSRREQQAEARISRMESELLQDMRSKATDMAVDATQRLLQEILDAQRHAVLISQAIKEMPKQVH